MQKGKFDLERMARFHRSPGTFEHGDDHGFFCALSCRITAAKCWLYLSSGNSTCRGCHQKLIRLRRRVERGEFSPKKAPIIGFYLTATTGQPGIEEDVKRFDRHRRDFRPAAGWVPMAAQQKAFEKAEKKLYQAPKEEKAPEPVVEVVTTQDPPQKMRIITRKTKKNHLWIDKCDGCGKKRDIVRYGLCQECLDAGK